MYSTCNENARWCDAGSGIAKNYENKTNMEDASSSSPRQALAWTSQARSNDSEDEL